MNSQTNITRRDFMVKGGGAILASTIVMNNAVSFAAQAGGRRRVAIVGTGGRGMFWCGEMLKNYTDVVDFVGLCDSNGKRVEAAQKILGITTPIFTDFDLMIKQTKPDAVLVTTVDAIHSRYILRGLELGCDVISEKPLCTDESQCQAILDAQKKSSKKIIVTHNARHYPEAKKIKQLIMDKALGDLVSVDYHEYLNTSHGSSYFHRWHHLKENSGTLLVTKSCHHFDQVNWWVNSKPVEVVARGDLRVYGRNGTFRSTHCRNCQYTKECKYYMDITKNDRLMKMYANCESEDGYLYDGCVFRMETNIYDTMSVIVKYENGVILSYTANAFLPYEGQAIYFNGSKGRVDWNTYSGGDFKNNELRLAPNFGKSEVITDLQHRTGGHGGADSSLQDMIFREPDAADPLGLRADVKQGAMAALIGIAAYRSIERGGAVVKIADLVTT
jgi:predicted dehydrogenase